MKRSPLILLAGMAIAASFAAAAIPFGSPSTKLGFLFAVKNVDCSGDDSCEGRFETRLVVIDGDTMRVAVQTPHLYVPRSSGFWEVGTIVPTTAPSSQTPSLQQGSEEETQTAEECRSFDWRLWAAPIGKNPTVATPPVNESQEENGNEIRRISLGWLGTDYVSVVEQIGEYTETHAVLSLDGVARNAVDQPWKPTIPEAVYAKDFEACVDEGSDFNTRSFLDGAEQGWSISRGTMCWAFTWSFGYSGGVARGYATTCATSLRPPRELVGNDSLGLGWNQVLPRVPDTRTAFSSPDRTLVLVFTNSQILALKREGNALAPPFARVFLPSGEIVSAQWAVGKYVDLWIEQLSQAKSWTETRRSTSEPSSN